MQRLYSMFPPRGPGVGLLLLRLSVAAALLAKPWLASTASPADWLIAGVPALALGLGAFTPVATTIAALIGLLQLGLSPVSGVPVAMLTVNISLALLLLGPGAYSFDARLFGRRVLVLPEPRQGRPPRG